jgi:hypothetical protein
MSEPIEAYCIMCKGAFASVDDATVCPPCVKAFRESPLLDSPEIEEC